MRVLHLISSTGFYGAENVIVSLAEQQKKQNFGVIIGVFLNTKNPDVEIAKESLKNKLKVQLFGCNGRLDLKVALEIRNFIKSNNIKILHCHGYKPNFYGILATSFLNVGLITTCHSWFVNSQKMRIYTWLDKFWIRKFDKIIAVSGGIKKELLESGTSENKILIINNGINTQNFKRAIKDERKEMKTKSQNINGITKNDKIVGTIGRLDIQKGQIYFLKAAKEVLKIYPNTKFLLVGDGPLKQRLEEKIKELNLENNITFTGFRADIPEILSLLDIFVLPSLKEGLPMALLEAMASKKPVIATDVGAIPKLIKNNKTGILIKPRNPQELSEAILSLLNDKEKAERLGNNGFLFVKKEFSSEKMAENHAQVYKEVLKERGYPN